MTSTPIIAIDPGTTRSGVVLLDGMEVSNPGKIDNDDVSDYIFDYIDYLDRLPGDPPVIAIETMKARGMPTSNDELKTHLWNGRFVQYCDCLELKWLHVYRHAVKSHICGTQKAKDSNIRQALIDQWGGKSVAVGLKKNPGPLYEVKKDAWQALAVAVTVRDNLDHYLEHTENGYLTKDLVR